jgi:hypothetical protein
MVEVAPVTPFSSSRGHVEVLDWWSGLELKYTDEAMDWASRYRHLEVLQWWKRCGLELKYTDEAMVGASIYGRVEVLQWWKESGIELKLPIYIDSSGTFTH